MDPSREDARRVDQQIQIAATADVVGNAIDEVVVVAGVDARPELDHPAFLFLGLAFRSALHSAGREIEMRGGADDRRVLSVVVLVEDVVVVSTLESDTGMEHELLAQLETGALILRAIDEPTLGGGGGGHHEGEAKQYTAKPRL